MTFVQHSDKIVQQMSQDSQVKGLDVDECSLVLIPSCSMSLRKVSRTVYGLAKQRMK